MAERLRLVSLRWPKPPAVLVDLAVSGTAQQLSRDTFKVSTGNVASSMSAATTRWGGERVVGERRSNATLSVTLLIRGTTKDAALASIQNVLRSALIANQPDLAIEWRPDGASYSVFWRLRGAASYGLSYSWAKFASANLFPIDVSFPVAPTGEGAPYDIFDDFSTDTIASGDWIKDSGVNSLLVSGGVLKPPTIGGAVPAMQYRHARGYPYGDVEVSATIRVSATGPLSGGNWRLCLGMDTSGAATYLALELTSTGSNLIKVVAGTRTVLSTAGTLTPSLNGTYYFLLRRAGNVLYWRIAASKSWSEWTVEPNTYQLTAADLRLAAPGHVGLVINAAQSDEAYDDFSARPYVYRDIQSPEQVQLVGQIVGEAPAFADVEITPVVGASPVPVKFGMVAWSERPKVQNMVSGGNFTTIRPGSTPTYGWSVAAISGVIGAATSYARGGINPPYYGLSSLQINCPATADTGGNYLIPRRFKRGRVYAALAKVSVASGSPNARMKLGVSGDLAVGPSVSMGALGITTSVVWQPTADRDSAYVTIGNVTAVIAALEASGIIVVESPAITLSASLTSSQTTLTPYYTPTDMPNLNPDGSIAEPFMVLVDLEQMLVTSITAGVWTVIRAFEGSTAATHTADAYVVVLPPARPQLEGKGAEPVFSVIEGENFAFDRQAATLVSSTDYRFGKYAPLAFAGSILEYYIDPSSCLPDDFQQSEVLVEVWARLAFDPDGIALTVQASVNSSETYDPTVALASTAGTARYPLEPACNPLSITTPSGTSGVLVPQMFRLGTIPMVSDRTRPQRWRLKLALTGTIGTAVGVDYLILVPIRNRAATPTGKAGTDQSYPTFMPTGATALAITKILRADGSGALRVPRLGTYSQPDAYPDSGLGHVIDLPNADCDVIVKLSDIIPNDSGVATGVEMFTAEPFWKMAMHVAVTPRLVAARGA